jgi:methionine-rich copper-binding protein CopC
VIKTHALSACIGAVLAVVAVVLAMTTAGVASAHAIRIATDPAQDAALAKGPERVSATFNEQLQTEFAAMTVVGPDGNLWSTGDTKIDGAIASVAVMPLGPVGSYTVNYRVTSADGHVVSGSWSFRLTTAGTGTPGPPASSASGESGSGGGVPIWPFVVAAVVIVGAAALWAARRRA